MLRTGVPFRFLKDHLGSVRMVVTGRDGGVLVQGLRLQGRFASPFKVLLGVARHASEHELCHVGFSRFARLDRGFGLFRQRGRALRR